MKFKQILPYKLRRALTIGAIAGSTLTACDNHTNEPIIPTRDVTVCFVGRNGVDIDSVKQYATMPEIRHIYIIPVGDWEVFAAGFVHKVREHLENAIIPIAPTKVSGNGVDGFKFDYGCVTPTDSLWFEQHGWPINRNAKQR